MIVSVLRVPATFRSRLLVSSHNINISVKLPACQYTTHHHRHHHQSHITLHIVKMPAITMPDLTAQIQGPVQTLKIDRDTWKAVALKYKAAFEAQTSRFKELQDVCFATQAELQNERVERRQLQELSEQRERNRMSTMDGADEPRVYGTATVFRGSHQRQASRESSNPLYSRVQHCIDQRNYGTALAEIERLLRGPLSAKARAEGLLLKSSILRAAGPDEVYGALAACSEALELCDRIQDLESFLPRIQHQRGTCGRIA